ncbi:hypothetical protein Back2_07890 [Nocardioides baekrokdamisoli]|uniref:Uncharacterized protein n=1 Tax=Nocardioides baekrokdamisoli TaxID=1804624 RepID=A0A3G9IDR3_9ACTN|nr:Rv3235 family protein [Nocardioides baekrokdamisoli]BBH16502.1 hypothetical protein Back2_07890 [Nocardioides baekrokdamisoli]
MGLDEAWLDDEPLDISVVPRTSPPLISIAVEAGGRGPHTELEVWIGRVVQAIVEIVGGDRPLTQAVRWTSPQVYKQLGRRTAHLGRVGAYTPGVGRVQRVRPRVSGVRSSASADGIVEAAITVRTGPRARAVAARFEQAEDRWICTVLDFGETPGQARPISAPQALRDTA